MHDENRMDHTRDPEKEGQDQVEDRLKGLSAEQDGEGGRQTASRKRMGWVLQQLGGEAGAPISLLPLHADVRHPPRREGLAVGHDRTDGLGVIARFA